MTTPANPAETLAQALPRKPQKPLAAGCGHPGASRKGGRGDVFFQALVGARTGRVPELLVSFHDVAL
jgi:hypothetical protein